MIRLREATREELETPHRIDIGDAPFALRSLLDGVAQLLPNGVDEHYGFVTLNCRTFAWLALLSLGFAQCDVDAAFTRRLGVEPFLRADDIFPVARKVWSNLLTFHYS